MQYMNRLKYAGSRAKASPVKPILAAKRRRQLYPFFFSMGPVPLSIISMLLIGLMAILYLSLLGQAVTANAKIQEMHNEQSVLQRQNEDLVNTIAQEQSPAYIATQAKKMGLVPADPSNVQIIVVKNLKPIPSRNQQLQP
jgi:cell division protein FtsL